MKESLFTQATKNKYISIKIKFNSKWQLFEMTDSKENKMERINIEN
jgi:hypothetical protein